MSTLLLEVRDKLQLTSLIDEIHDWSFDLDAFLMQRGSDRFMDLRPTPVLFQAGSEVPSRRLWIHNVRDVIVRDLEEVGSYDINEVRYRPPELEFLTGVPLTLRIVIDDLHLRLCDAGRSD